jgi:hypothetical protein
MATNKQQDVRKPAGNKSRINQETERRSNEGRDMNRSHSSATQKNARKNDRA